MRRKTPNGSEFKTMVRRIITESFEESVGSDVVSAARSFVEQNQFLKQYAATLTEENLHDLGRDYTLLLLPNTFNHTKHSHSAISELPGSKFNSVDDNNLLNIMQEIVESGEPHEKETRGGSEILKWFNVDLGRALGKDSLITPEEAQKMGVEDYDFYEPIGNKRAIPAIIQQGLQVYDSKEPGSMPLTPEDPIDDAKQYFIKQPLKVGRGGMKDTNLATLIVSSLGELPDGRTLVSLMTMFPGFSDPRFKNKQDYVKAGYAFVKSDGTLTTESFRPSRWQLLAGIKR